MEGKPAEKKSSWVDQPVVNQNNRWSSPSENVVALSNKKRKRKRLNPRQVLLPLMAGIVFILLWQEQVLHGIFGLQTYQLPLPSAILTAMSENMATLLA